VTLGHTTGWWNSPTSWPWAVSTIITRTPSLCGCWRDWACGQQRTDHPDLVTYWPQNRFTARQRHLKPARPRLRSRAAGPGQPASRIWMCPSVNQCGGFARAADEQDWLRRRVLSFLSAACFDDVRTAKESPAVGAELVTVGSRAVVGVRDLSVEGAPPAHEISDSPWHRCKDLHRRGRAVDRIHTPRPHQRSARPGWFAQFGVVGRLCHRPALPF
jgi:hypothetical protein